MALNKRGLLDYGEAAEKLSLTLQDVKWLVDTDSFGRSKFAGGNGSTGCLHKF